MEFDCTQYFKLLLVNFCIPHITTKIIKFAIYTSVQIMIKTEQELWMGLRI